MPWHIAGNAAAGDFANYSRSWTAEMPYELSTAIHCQDLLCPTDELRLAPAGAPGRQTGEMPGGRMWAEPAIGGGSTTSLEPPVHPTTGAA
jgi:hypothetical protein